MEWSSVKTVSKCGKCQTFR